MGIWLDEAGREEFRRALQDAWSGPGEPVFTALAEGWGSAAFESPEGIVALAAKNEIGAHSRRVTCALTPWLAPRVAEELPMPVWSVESAPGLAHGAYGYRKLTGRTWTWDEAKHGSRDMAHALATFFLALHSLPVEEARERGIPSFDDFWQDLTSLRAETDATLRQRLAAGEYATVRAWWDGFLGDQRLLHGPRCVVHGDLWWDNLLVDEAGESLTGIIDFGSAAVVDPAYDFVPASTAGPAMLAACVEAYRQLGGRVDPGFEHRLSRWRELRTASWYSLRASIREDDESELQRCLGELRRSRVLTPSPV